MGYFALKKRQSYIVYIGPENFDYGWVTFPSSELEHIWIANPSAKLQSQPYAMVQSDKDTGSLSSFTHIVCVILYHQGWGMDLNFYCRYYGWWVSTGSSPWLCCWRQFAQLLCGFPIACARVSA